MHIFLVSVSLHTLLMPRGWINYHNLWYAIQVLETVPDHVLLAFSGREYN